nr:reverse transcriptase domain-containing protein [Tanacetum cinerariifolium]
MAEDDEEKTGFHTKEGVYCFTHMPKGLKNSTTTLQRLKEKVLANQKGRNVEVYLEEIVMKSKSEQSLVQDVEETLRKLRRMNIRINVNESTFKVEEGNAASPIVHAAGQNCSNSTNPISAVGPSNSNSSSTHRNSSLRDASQSPDVLEMENIVYYNNENVGAKTDFNNLETSLTFSPIPTTRIYNAHPISQTQGKRAIGTKWVYRNKKDERGIVVRN